MEGQEEDDGASNENEFVWSFLKKFQFLSAAKQHQVKKACFIDNARDSGTDHNESVIMKTKTVDANMCQKRCQSHKECNFFLYLTQTHPQWYKRRECRLLRKTGILTNHSGHISGPKYCNLSASTSNRNDSVKAIFPSPVKNLEDATSHNNLAQLVEDFLNLICRLQDFSGSIASENSYISHYIIYRNYTITYSYLLIIVIQD